jgi:hypothetical protein
MTPLHTFHQIIKALSQKPFEFLDEKEQTILIGDTSKVFTKLKKQLEKEELTNTHGYKVLCVLGEDLKDMENREVFFVQHIGNLLEVYHKAELGEELKEFLYKFESEVSKAKNKVLEYHVSLENLSKQGKKMSDEEKIESDLKTLQNVGVFYVLEYTLQVLFEFTQQSEENIIKLLDEGLQTEAGNLPGYRPLEDTFRKELCYKIFDKTLRDKLLEAFYKFEEVLYHDDVKLIANGLKIFNISLLYAFQYKGITEYKAAVYTPFGNNVSIEEIIKKIQQV